MTPPPIQMLRSDGVCPHIRYIFMPFFQGFFLRVNDHHHFILPPPIPPPLPQPQPPPQGVNPRGANGRKYRCPPSCLGLYPEDTDYVGISTGTYFMSCIMFTSCPFASSPLLASSTARAHPGNMGNSPSST